LGDRLSLFSPDDKIVTKMIGLLFCCNSVFSKNQTTYYFQFTRFFMSDKIYNVLFLCTGNSARSIMAEGILNHIGNGRFRAFSAGSMPTGVVNSYALKQLEKEGIFLENPRSKSWEEFAQPDAPQLDFVITVCDNAAGEVCPIWAGQPITAHWGVFDSAAVEEEQKNIAFAQAFAILHRRISLFASLNPSSLNQLALQNSMSEIGKVS
jgi:arsenate reductase